jgi:TrmH family RNA methyltransferase
VKLLTIARDLQRRKARERHQRFVAEGVRTVEALLASPLTVTGLLHTADLMEDARGAAVVKQAMVRGITVKEVSDADFASAADTDAPQGVLAIAEMPSATLEQTVAAGTRFLVLDALQDPGNVGTVVRTAAALGVHGTIVLPGTVDVWNAKVVRSAMGALFHHPVLALDWEAFAAFAAAHEVPVWAADMAGDPVESLDRRTLPPRLALVVSNEGAGLSPHVAAAVTRQVRITMAPGTESLNVAVATGILLHALRPA